MLRMVICCGGGMSSSVISVQIKKAIEDKGWEDEISVAFMPLLFLVKHQEEFDIAMLCPHTMHHAQEMARKNEIQLPMYVIPARLYGSMNLEYLREDAEDILKIYAETKENPLHFPEKNFWRSSEIPPIAAGSKSIRRQCRTDSEHCTITQKEWQPVRHAIGVVLP
ncbi:MAG: PTS sugar transporter subunit IIB [[Clostridium] innocuum]